MTTSPQRFDAPAALPASGACPACGASVSGASTVLTGYDRQLDGAGEFRVARCPECGLAVTDPRPGPAELAAFYPDAYQSYVAVENSRGLVRRLFSRLEAARLEVAFRIGPYRRLRRVAPGRLLDVGCGRGGLTERFVRLGWSAAGVEPSEHAAAQARLRGVDVHVGVLDDAPWARETFDVVLFNHSLEHIPDPVGALRTAAKLLKPGGHMGIAVPNFGSWQRRAFGSDWFHLDVPRHLQHFDAATLPDVVGRVGLEVVEVRTMSMSAGLQASLQYRFFGRPRLNGAAWRLAAWATLPLIAVADRLGQGDCVSVVARRPAI